jgi:hypothetical protein
MRIQSVTQDKKTGAAREPAPKRAGQESSSPVGRQALLTLQRRAGNRATVDLIQHKLEVGSVDDPLEAEADQIAHHVLWRISAPQPDPREPGPARTNNQSQPFESPEQPGGAARLAAATPL